jgi:hypothetical protein
MMIMTGDADQERRWPRQDVKQVQEWLGQTNLIYGGLIAIGVAMVQPFLMATSLDLSSSIWIAGVGILVSGLVGVTVHTAGYTWLERHRETDRRESEEHDDLGPTAGD